MCELSSKIDDCAKNTREPVHIVMVEKENKTATQLTGMCQFAQFSCQRCHLLSVGRQYVARYQHLILFRCAALFFELGRLVPLERLKHNPIGRVVETVELEIGFDDSSLRFTIGEHHTTDIRKESAKDDAGERCSTSQLQHLADIVKRVDRQFGPVLC